MHLQSGIKGSLLGMEGTPPITTKQKCVSLKKYLAYLIFGISFISSKSNKIKAILTLTQKSSNPSSKPEPRLRLRYYLMEHHEYK